MENSEEENVEKPAENEEKSLENPDNPPEETETDKKHLENTETKPNGNENDNKPLEEDQNAEQPPLGVDSPPLEGEENVEKLPDKPLESVETAEKPLESEQLKEADEETDDNEVTTKKGKKVKKEKKGKKRGKNKSDDETDELSDKPASKKKKKEEGKVKKPKSDLEEVGESEEIEPKLKKVKKEKKEKGKKVKRDMIEIVDKDSGGEITKNLKKGKKGKKMSPKDTLPTKDVLLGNDDGTDVEDDESDESVQDDEEQQQQQQQLEEVKKKIGKEKKTSKTKGKKGKNKVKEQMKVEEVIIYENRLIDDNEEFVRKSMSSVRDAMSSTIMLDGRRSVKSLKDLTANHVIVKLEEELTDSTISSLDIPQMKVEIVSIEDLDSGKKKKKKKTKKKKKEKLSKEEREKADKQKAEKNRKEEEERLLREAEELRIKLEEERKEGIEKCQRELFEYGIRMEQLRITYNIIKDVINFNYIINENEKMIREWKIYLKCGPLPDPMKFDQMNTYLYLWDMEIQTTTIEQVAERALQVIEILSDIDDIMDDLRMNPITNEKIINDLNILRFHFRDQLEIGINMAIYRLLRKIEKNLNRINIPTADYHYANEQFILSIWLPIQLPVPFPNPRRPTKPRISLTFDLMKMNVLLPIDVDCDKMALKALYLKYDHLSDLCETYEKPNIPKEYQRNLWKFTKNEWRQKLLYKYNNSNIENKIEFPLDVCSNDEDEGIEEEQEEYLQMEEEEEEEGGGDTIPKQIPIVPWKKLEPTPSEYVLNIEDIIYNENRKNLLKLVTKHTINLRKFTIIGGLYVLNLLKQPPQPQGFVTLEMNMTSLVLPKELKTVPFYIKYTPPEMPEPPEGSETRLPEDMEKYFKILEESLDTLIMITIQLPSHVLYLELPIVCYWHEKRKIWTTKYIFDLKHNEEQNYLTFRTGRMGIFGLAVNKYINFPYQTWELRPEINGTVTFQITAAILMLEFNVKENLICLTELQNSPNNALQDLIGIYFKLPKLIRILQNAGIDVFPHFDAFCYVESGTCEKHWPMEKHLYFNMAQMCLCFNFTWSRWNLTAGRRNIVLQMREYYVERPTQKDYKMLHVTPFKAIFVNCTEVSQVFNEDGIEEMKFYSDMFHLMKGTSNMVVKNRVNSTSKSLIYVVSELLISTRVLSFS